MEEVLTSKKVENVFKDCLFRKNEKEGKLIEVKGLVNVFGFHSDRVKEHKEEIKGFLNELSSKFFKDEGGGWSFLNLCMTKDDKQWTDLHLRMEQLVCLGIAIEKVKYTLPREMWSIFPGGVPYVVINMKCA